MRQARVSGLSAILNPIARVSFCLFLLITSLYCLLAYIPFTYHWVIKGELLAWLPVFVKYHPCFYLAVLGLVSPTIARDMHRVATRRLVLGFYIFHIAAGAWLIFRPVLPALDNDAGSFKWALISLTPLLWLAAIDYVGHFKQNNWSKEEHQRTNRPTLRNSATSALFLCSLYAVICYLRFRSMLSFSRTELFVIACWTLVSHLLIFLAAFIALSLAQRVANQFRHPAKSRFILTGLMAGILGALVIRYFILSAISFEGFLANIYALAVSLAVTLFLSGVKLRSRQHPESGSYDAVPTISDAHADQQTPSWMPWVPRGAIWVLVLTAAAYLIPASVARMDWDFLMQKLSVIAVWTATFVLWNTMTRTRNSGEARPFPMRGVVLIVVLCLGGYSLMNASESRLPRLLRNDKLNVNATLEEYATYDISFKVAHEMLSNISNFSILSLLRSNAQLVPTANAASGDSATSQPNEDNGFYGYLKKNTNLMASVKVEPVDVNLVDDLKPTNGDKPNIFIFVVDSLRSDYLSSYNNDVPFTPNIASFARESVVMENAFTPYGGTVLAEPAIWTGTMQIHKQYVEPFYRMNALQKLVETENYQPFITIDPVLKIILKPSSSIVELDKDLTGWQGLDFVNTLRQLRTKLDERQDKSRPIFAYTQPQNLHVHKLNRERREGPPAYEFPGFEPYYSSQIKHIDEGFGEFIQYLKDTGQYDNSIVVLTSDHGDSLGEGGRWGHANWIFPEILKIPIVIHLPTKYQKSLYWDTHTIAFSDDLTPSLYYILGHRPIVRNDVFGKPLFTVTQKEQADYQKRSYMVASSYGPTYGILSDNGRSLFISDAANSKDYFFNLKGDPKGTRNTVNGDVRSASEKLIRRYVDAINSFYHFSPDNSESVGK